MNIQLLDIINVATTPLAGLIGWFAGRRKQKNDFLGQLQTSIDLLAKKNSEQMGEIITLREEVVGLRKENSQLRLEVELLSKKLENVKTITKSNS